MDIPTDQPPSFYFNGVKLPGWTSQWHLCQLDFHSGELWDEFVDLPHIWHLQCRLDHVGSVESEDPVIFRICAQEMLLRMISDRDGMLSKIAATCTGHSAEVIYEEMTDGIGEMLRHAAADEFAFWTNGGEGDLAALQDTIARYQLPKDHPLYREAPHVIQRASEQRSRISSQLSEMRSISSNGSLDKRLRTLINQLPSVQSKEH